MQQNRSFTLPVSHKTSSSVESIYSSKRPSKPTNRTSPTHQQTSEVNSSISTSSSSERMSIMQRRQNRMSGVTGNGGGGGGGGSGSGVGSNNPYVQHLNSGGGSKRLSGSGSRSISGKYNSDRKFRPSPDQMSVEELQREADRIMNSSKSYLTPGNQFPTISNSNNNDEQQQQRSEQKRHYLKQQQKSQSQSQPQPQPQPQSQPESQHQDRSIIQNPATAAQPAGGSGINALRNLSSRSPKKIEGGSNNSLRGIVGLQNLGNTCFMNSGLQCLFNTSLLQDYFVNGDYKQNLCSKSPMKGQLALGFAETFQAVQRQKANSSVNPMGLKNLVGKWAPHLAGYSQQDSQEFMRFLLDGLAEDLNKTKIVRKKPGDQTDEELGKLTVEMQSRYWWNRHLASNDSFITETFCGQLMSTVVCMSCKTKSQCFDPFYDLSVPIPTVEEIKLNNNGSGEKGGMNLSGLLKRPSMMGGGDGGSGSGKGLGGKGGGGGGSQPSECSLDDCLKSFTREEVLDGENKPMCAKCKKRRKSTKQISIYKFPPVLVLHIKRFANMRKKLTTDVSLGGEGGGIDMAKYGCGAGGASGAGGGSERARFELYAVSNHVGSLNGGHYTANCYNEVSKNWYCFNDSHVSNLGSGDRGDGGDAGLPYLLFFKRVGAGGG